MCCHAQSLPDESELQKPVKSAEVLEHLGCNEVVEFREKNTPSESVMDVEYLQKDNFSSKCKCTENKLEIHRGEFEVDTYDKIKADRALKQFLNFSGQESGISDNTEYKLHAVQESIVVFGNQNKEKENGRKDCFVSSVNCLSVNSDPVEMLNQQIVNGDSQKTERVSKKLSDLEAVHKNKEKDISQQGRSSVPTKEEFEMQSETDFELTTKKDEVIPKTGKHALDISPYVQQHFSARTLFESQHKEHCPSESSNHNTLNSEHDEFQVCDVKADSLSAVRCAVPLEKVSSSFRELAVHNGNENIMKLSLQSVSNPDISDSDEKDTNKLHGTFLDESYFMTEIKILGNSNLNPNKTKSKIQGILDISSGNIVENQHVAKVSQLHTLDFEMPPMQSDPSLSIELLGDAGDLNDKIAPSESISGGENYFRFSEHGLGKKLLSHDEKLSDKEMLQSKIYGLDSVNISMNKPSGENKLEDGQKCQDLLLVGEMESKAKGHSKNILGKNSELQKIVCENAGNKYSLEKEERPKKNASDNEEKRSTDINEVPAFLYNATETINLKMILNQSKSISESQNMSRSS
nr:uncharacterized protein LOC112996841 [Dromaius novaehollandiae]